MIDHVGFRCPTTRNRKAFYGAAMEPLGIQA